MSESASSRRPEIGRTIGRPSDGDQRILDQIAVRIGEVQSELVSHRGALDDLDRRVANLENVRRKPVATPPDWDDTRDHATAMLATVAQSTAAPTPVGGSVIASGEHLLKALGDDSAPGWYTELLERFPGIDPGSVAAIATAGPSNELNGMLHLLRGFRGEQLVAEMLASGALPAPPGTVDARLSATTTQPGVDLELTTDSGTIVEAQIKISSSSNAVAEHLDRYPEVRVVYASSDAADGLEGVPTAVGPITVVRPGDPWPMGDGPIVIDAGSASGEYGAETLEAMAAGAPEDLLDMVLDEIPVFAFGFLAMKAAHTWATTDEANTEIVAGTLTAAKDVGINSAVGSAAGFLTGADLIAAPVTLTTALTRASWRSATTGLQRSVQRVDRAGDHLAGLRGTMNSRR